MARTRLDVLRQDDGVIVHFLEQVADRRPRMFGMARGIPLKRAQKLLPYRVVVRMAEGAQARRVQRFGLSMQSAQHRPMPMVRQKRIVSPRLAV